MIFSSDFKESIRVAAIGKFTDVYEFIGKVRSWTWEFTFQRTIVDRANLLQTLQHFDVFRYCPISGNAPQTADMGSAVFDLYNFKTPCSDEWILGMIITLRCCRTQL